MASHAAQLHSLRFQSYRPYSSPCHITLVSTVPPPERAGLRPRVPTTFLRETVRLRLWTRVFLSIIQGSSADPDGSSNTYPDGG